MSNCNSGNILNNFLNEASKYKNCKIRYMSSNNTPADTITIGKVTSTDNKNEAQIIDNKIGNNHTLDFILPRGEKGEIGNGDTITIGETKTGDPGTQAEVISEKIGTNNVLEFIIPRGYDGLDGVNGATGATGPAGPTGPQGPEGPEKIKSTYIITFNQFYSDEGIEIKENQRLPLERKGVDSSSICNLDTNENILTFNLIGTYKIDFTISCYVKQSNVNFDLSSDFISVGFRNIDGEVIYTGASGWCTNEIPTTLVGTGLFVVKDLSDQFELYNFTKKSIFLNSPNISNINTSSYFTNPLVKITIEYLGI